MGHLIKVLKAHEQEKKKQQREEGTKGNKRKKQLLKSCLKQMEFQSVPTVLLSKMCEGNSHEVKNLHLGVDCLEVFMLNKSLRKHKLS